MDLDATELDTDDTIQFSSSDIPAAFTLNATTGAITISNGTDLDYETQETHYAVQRDGYGQHRGCGTRPSVTIMVTNKDEIACDRGFSSPIIVEEKRRCP